MNKPKITRDKVTELLKKTDIDVVSSGFCLIGVEGYFLNSMGKKGVNDIGIYDDGFIWYGSQGEFATFNGNVDPSRYYKNVATLDYGVWWYKKGYHKYNKPSGHWAFRQAEPVRVRRYQSDGSFITMPLGDTINIHRGGKNSTSSAGCQTVPPDQWDAFREYGYMLLKKYGVPHFPYLKVRNTGSIA